MFVMVKLKENDTRDRRSERVRKVVMERYRYKLGTDTLS